jgi:Icc-related predicted phosphoesterase
MHGSEGVWRKFLNASAMLKVDVAICGGDLTGKMLVPVVKHEGWQILLLSLEKNPHG